jgi:hypothetical protein
MKIIKRILEIGQINGYSKNNILRIIHRHEETARRENLSTFYNTANQNPFTKRISVLFFKQYKIDLVTTSSGYKLKNQLDSTKDMKPTNEKSGVYEIKCERAQISHNE